jgi:hypothetical protein
VIFNDHSKLAGTHAFLSASNYYWIGYSEDKLEEYISTAQAARRGTEMHELACRLIRMGVELPDVRKTINMYVNDAIGFKMEPEVVLYYSPFCYGTVDTICFRKNTLRIHDLKNGKNKASEKQLYVYSAMFCLEYGFNPQKIETILRIYQNNDVFEHLAEPDYIEAIMAKIVAFVKRIEERSKEAEL